MPKLFFSIHFIHHSFFACQLLGIKMNEINCCDSKPQSRDMIRENFYGAKIFESLNDQIDDGSGIETDYDFGIIGTPCQPFSRQRVKRSAEGSVKGHKSYSTTFDDFVSWMTHFQPNAQNKSKAWISQSPLLTVAHRWRGQIVPKGKGLKGKQAKF